MLSKSTMKLTMEDVANMLIEVEDIKESNSYGVFCEIRQCGAPDVARKGFGGAR